MACGTSSKLQEANPGSRPIKIGISQFAQHGSLDNCRLGFLEGLAEAGFVEGDNLIVDYQNANADMAIAAQIAQGFVAKKYDLIMAVATPAAMHAFNAITDKDIPLIYTAVSDPVAAGFADEDGRPKGNATGTSDALPVEAQLKMIREILPEAKSIGILYTLSETNSESTIKLYQALAENYGFDLVTTGINTGADIPLALDRMLDQVDCLSNLTDNTVVNSLPLILDKAYAKKIPVFGSEIEQVDLGCVAAEGVDYLELGRQTGLMAGQILKGESKASEVPFQTTSKAYLYLNSLAAEKLGIGLSQDLIARADQVFDYMGKE